MNTSLLFMSVVVRNDQGQFVSRKRQRLSPIYEVDEREGPSVVEIMDMGVGGGSAMTSVGTQTMRRRRYYRRKKRVVRRRTYRRSSTPRYSFTSNGSLTQVVGRGGYFSDAFRRGAHAAHSYLKDAVPKGTISRSLGMLGERYGGSVGRHLGGAVGSGISSIVGFGDYHVSKNSILHPLDEGQGIPSFGNLSQGTIIRHREFITDVKNNGTGFINALYPIQPALAVTFPWLSQVACNFDSYQIMGMIFEFVSTSSDITSGGALGSVIMGTDYDTKDAAYPNKLIMENAQYSVSTKPSCSMIHAIECDPAVTNSSILYTRDGSVPAGADVRLYDHGNFQIATSGLPAGGGGSTIGELWVSYEIALYKPQIQQIPGISAMFTLSNDITTGGAYLTTGALVPTYGTLGGTAQGSTYFFPDGTSSGTYLMEYRVTGASTTLTAKMDLTPFNCTNTPILWEGATRYFVQQLPGVVSTSQYLSHMVTVTNIGAKVTYSLGTLPGTITSGSLIVTKVNLP